MKTEALPILFFNDLKNLTECFSSLKFEVIVHKNLTKKETIVETSQKNNHKKSDILRYSHRMEIQMIII